MINYAWDTTVMIAWLSEDQRAPLGDIGLVVSEIDKQVANLILSVTTFAEILESKYTQEKLDIFQRFLQRSNVITVDTSIVIAKKASQIRNAGLQEGRKIKTPDATVLATAIQLRANVLHSLDAHQLNLNESLIVDGLKITAPRPLSGQMGMPWA